MYGEQHTNPSSVGVRNQEISRCFIETACDSRRSTTTAST